MTGVGSGRGGVCPKLRWVLSDPCARVVVVEHRDRVARFRAGDLEAVPGVRGRRIVLAVPGESTGDVVRGMVGVLTSRCAGVFGRGGARSRAMRAVTRWEPGGRCCDGPV
jgi:putative resolvase